MGSASRRSFLKRLLGVLPAWGSLSVTGATTVRVAESSRSDRLAAPSSGTLAAVGEIVLPVDELGSDGLARAIEDFETWRDGFSPRAELDHPYLWSDDLRYGPPDPRPGWSRQLQALEAEAMSLRGKSFGDLERAERTRLIEAQLAEDAPDDLPHASESAHVAVALMSWFFSTPQANDLCYRAAIGRHTCRGLPDVGEEPRRLAAARQARPGEPA